VSRVALLECRKYDKKEIEIQLNRLRDLTDFPEIKGKRVLLKPNLLLAVAPDRAATTHPELLRGVIRLIQSMEPESVMVGDSPGVGSTQTAAKVSGLYQVCQETGVHWINFYETAPFTSKDSLLHKQFFLAKEVKEADVIISLPKLKTHGLMYFTGALKNLFGLLPGLDKAGFHMRYHRPDDFARMVVDLNLTVKAQYAIMDGIIAMEGRGPGNGTPRTMNVILGSSDLLALDIEAANLIGYKGATLPIHKIALESPRWINSEEEIELTGDSKEKFICPHFKRISQAREHAGLVPPWLQPLLKGWIVPRPVFKHSTCIRCGKCLEICPANALTFKSQGEGKKVAIDYEKCIRCYCCDEICPVGAIHLKRRF
jgi:uncharacterized protein (DUF362 family)/Pyruvate/2-oxoacid:ferredoxin oxidoreductase delta subunit